MGPDAPSRWPLPVVRRRMAVALGLLWALLVAGCAANEPRRYAPEPGEPVIAIHVVTQAWHTGLVVPRATIAQGLLPELADFEGFQRVEIGWGERDFYMARHETVWMALQALFWANDSVIHIAGVRTAPEDSFPQSEIVRIELSRDAFDALSAHLHAAFARAPGGAAAEPLGPGLYGTSSFYPARGTFSLFRLCNAWTAQALQAAGLPVRSFGVYTREQLMRQVRQFGEVVQAKSS